MQTKYHIITSHEEVRKLVKACKTTGYCSYDFETNAQPRYKKEFKPTILSISFMPGFGCSIPLDHFETSQYVEEGWDWKKELKYFGEKVICNPDITKVAQNAKFDNQILELYDIYYRGVLLDTMLAKYILDENTPHGLKDLVRKYLPEYGDYEKQDAFDKIPWDQKPLEPLCQYGCQDTDYTLRLMIFFEKKLIDKGLYSLYRNMIMAASRVLTAVEKNGLYMDREFNQHLLETYKPKIDDARNTCLELPRVKKFAKAFSQEKVGAYINSLEEELEQLDENNPADKRKIASRQQKISNIKAGIFSTKKEQDLIRPVNLGSNIDLTQLMFLHPKGFKFPINKTSDSGKPSTDEETLVALRLTIEDPESAKAIFLDRLLELRGLEKMYKTYILGWSEKVQDDSCLHGRFNIQGCVTGDTLLVGSKEDIRLDTICPKEKGIQNIEGKDLWVLSHEGTWEQITHTINKGYLPTYEITTEDGNILKCTKDHKLLTPLGMKRVSYIFKKHLPIIMHDVSRLDITQPKQGKSSKEVIFKEVPGWAGYLVSNEGKVYSVKVPGSHILDYNHPHELIPRCWGNGKDRKRVYFRDKRITPKKVAFTVSRLVWTAFNGTIPEGMVIDHIDCNPLNNNLENLQCITSSENIKRAYKLTRRAYTNGSINGMTVTNTQDVGSILLEYSKGSTQGELKSKYNLSQKQISRIINRQAWKYIYLTHIKTMEYKGEQLIYDLSVNNKHSYVTRSNFINSNTSSGRLSSADPNAQQIPKTSVDPNIKQQLVARPGTLYLASDFSQCIEGNSYIFCNRGLKKLKDIQPGKDKIYLMDPQWVNHSRLLNIEGLAYKGTAKCLKIITNTGRELVLTEDHPVKTYGGFTKAQELKIGDNLYIENVASSKRIGNIHIPKDEAYIAGLFYGDGYYPGCHSGQRKSTDRSISFSTGSDRKELVPLLNQYFKTEFNDPKELTHVVRASSDVVLDFYEKYPKVDSHNMYIPARIMQADWESKMHFIGGQIDSDGSIGSSRFRYTSVCKEYILQLQLLFQSVGWNGLVREATIKLNGKEFKAYHLIVQSIKAIRRLKKYVRLARKKADCQECLDNKIGARPCNKSPHDPTHRIPWEVYNELPYTKEFYKARNNSRRKKRLICTTLKPYLDELTELDSRWQDVYWFKYEQVERIEVVGEKDVYDLSVEKLHEFNPNGIRVHNCELRVMAHLSGDETYLNAFASGQDPHLAIACKKYHVDYDEILKIHEDESHPDHKLWSVRRKQAKQLAFGLIYGIGASLLAVKLSDPKAGLIVSKEEAQKQMDEFFEEHPKLKTFKAKQERYLKKNGYLKSLFGRKRRLPEIYSGNKEQEAYALRLGLNFPCLLPTSQALCKTKGWVNSDNLQAGDEILAFNSKTGKSEWQPVLEVHTPDYDGDLYKFNSKHCGILSTSYHRWYVSKSEFYEDDIKHRQVQDKEIEEFFTLQKIIHSKYEGGKNLHQISQELNIPYVKVRRIYYGKMKSPLSTKPLEPFEVMTSDEIYNSKGNCRIPVRAYHNNTNENSYTDTFIALCGWYLTDAHIRNNGSIRITQSDSANHEKVLHIRKLLVESGLEYKENIRISDISTAITWSISKDSSSKFIGVLPDRKLNMAFITSLTQAQLEILLYNMRLGDGYSTLCSGDKEQASLIQAMVVLIGKTSSMFRLSYKGKRSYFKNHQPSKLGQEYIEATKDSWGIKFSDRGSIHTKSYGRKLVEKVPYKGKVWCPSVPSGAFFVRYIGDDGRYRTMITGNCQSAASDMCLFGSILIFYLMRQGKLPKMDSVCLVHDANYMNTKPEYINVWTVYTMWNIYRNPSTKHYFGFQIKDVDMDMDFELGRSMAEELPFVPMYDYRKMLQPDFDLEAYMEEAKKYKHISIKDYPKYFAKEMKQYEEDFIKGLY